MLNSQIPISSEFNHTLAFNCCLQWDSFGPEGAKQGSRPSETENIINPECLWLVAFFANSLVLGKMIIAKHLHAYGFSLRCIDLDVLVEEVYEILFLNLS
jgi:hypothetical protein